MLSSKKIATTVGISEPLMDLLREYAKSQKRSLSFVVEEALAAYFSRRLQEGWKSLNHANESKAP